MTHTSEKFRASASHLSMPPRILQFLCLCFDFLGVSFTPSLAISFYQVPANIFLGFSAYMQQYKESIFGTTFTEISPDSHSHWPGSDFWINHKADQVWSNTPQKTTVNHMEQRDGTYLSHVVISETLVESVNIRRLLGRGPWDKNIFSNMFGATEFNLCYSLKFRR